MHREQILMLLAALAACGCAGTPAHPARAPASASPCDASATERGLQDVSRAIPPKPLTADAEKMTATMAADSRLRAHLQCLMRESAGTAAARGTRDTR